MCLLIAKPKGVALPPKECLRNGFMANPDGAGFAVAKGRHILVKKGFMHFPEFYHNLRSAARKQDGAIIHFRLATHGKKDAANCHPFPITRDPSLLGTTKARVQCPVMGHNGVLAGYDYSGKWSDTAQFVMGVLADPAVCDHLASDAIQQLLARLGSKFAFLWPDGSILWIGDAIEEDGVWYSNRSYEGWGWPYGRWSCRRDSRAWVRDEEDDDIVLTYDRATDNKWRTRRGYVCEICGKWREDTVYRSSVGLMVCDDCYLTEVLGICDPLAFPALGKGVKDASDGGGTGTGRGRGPAPVARGPGHNGQGGAPQPVVQAHSQPLG